MTGSYDCTAKVWSRSDWSLLHRITLHTDSVWDITIKPSFHIDSIDAATIDNSKINYTFATAGLDGAVGVFHLMGDSSDKLGLKMSFLLQVSVNYKRKPRLKTV